LSQEYSQRKSGLQRQQTKHPIHQWAGQTVREIAVHVERQAQGTVSRARILEHLKSETVRANVDGLRFFTVYLLLIIVGGYVLSLTPLLQVVRMVLGLA
jgi:hypothetical protein